MRLRKLLLKANQKDATIRLLETEELEIIWKVCELLEAMREEIEHDLKLRVFRITKDRTPTINIQLGCPHEVDNYYQLNKKFREFLWNEYDVPPYLTEKYIHVSTTSPEHCNQPNCNRCREECIKTVKSLGTVCKST